MGEVLGGRYELLDAIARGGSGSLWRVRDIRTGQIRAAKVMRHRDSADLLRMFRETSAQFDHPHLLAPDGWIVDDSSVLIAMPLVEGGTLDYLIRTHGPLDDNSVGSMMCQVLSGLSHMHEQRWIHRDVKPANVLWDATGYGPPRARLADFGIAVHRDDARFTRTGMINGTRGFLDPDIFQGSEPHPRHDLYALGITALAALNEPRTVRPDDGELLPSQLRRWLAAAGPDLTEVVTRLVGPDPRRRYTTTEEVMRDLSLMTDLFAPLRTQEGRRIKLVPTLPPLEGTQESAPSAPSPPALTRATTPAPAPTPAPATTPAPAPAEAPGRPPSPTPSPLVPAPPPLAAVGPDVRPTRLLSARRRSKDTVHPGKGYAAPAPPPRRGSLRGVLSIAAALAVVASGAWGVSALAEAWTPRVEDRVVVEGIACPAADVGLIGVTPEGRYLSCVQTTGGYAYR